MMYAVIFIHIVVLMFGHLCHSLLDADKCNLRKLHSQVTSILDRLHCHCDNDDD